MSLDRDQGRKPIHRVATAASARQHSCEPSGPPWRRLLAAPTRTHRHPSYGVQQGHSLVTCLGPCPLVQPPWLSEKQVIPTGNLHQTKNRTQQEDQALFIVCRVLSHACIHSCPIGSLGGGRDYNHPRLPTRHLELRESMQAASHLSETEVVEPDSEPELWPPMLCFV